MIETRRRGTRTIVVSWLTIDGRSLSHFAVEKDGNMPSVTLCGGKVGPVKRSRHFAMGKDPRPCPHCVRIKSEATS